MVVATHSASLLRLMFQLEGELQQITTVFHDVAEDIKWTFENLRKVGFDERPIEVLNYLILLDGESYKEFIDCLAPNALISLRRVFFSSLLLDLIQKASTATP